MDPDETLARLRSAVRDLFDSHADVREEAAQDVGGYFTALDDWLAKGGFPPAEWRS